MRQSPLFWAILTIVLLLIAASRFIRLDDLPMNPDEIWSVWQTFGTPQQIIQWTPYDWPPLYYLVLGAWRSVAGASPLVLRAFSALWFMLGATFAYRVMQRLRGAHAGVIAMLAYAALGFSILLSLEVRGYALLMALMPLGLWLTLRYFDHPDWRRALPLGIVLAAMFYVSLTSMGAFLMLGLYTLLVYRHNIWRWWLPGGIAGVLAAPEIINKASIATERVAATASLNVPPLATALLQIYQDYAGLSFALWAILFLVALVLLIYRRHRLNVHLVALLLWALLMPLAMYLLNPLLGFFSPRYAWWIMPGIALGVSWGLAYLSRPGLLAVSVVLVAMLFYPLRTDGEYRIWNELSPLNENFAWLRDNIQWGDAVVGNASQRCGAPEVWDYYLRLYFPNGLTFVDEPDSQRRLWILNPNDQPEAIRAVLDAGYVPERFVGPPGCLLRLYEAPPNVDGVLFDNGMRFHGYDIMEGENPMTGPLVRREAEPVRLRLWWSVDHPPVLDYSVSTYLARGNNFIDRIDGPPAAFYPADAPLETTRWIPGQFYVEERTLTLPFPAYGAYRLGLVVYFWADGVPIAAPGVNKNGHLPLGQVTVKSY